MAWAARLQAVITTAAMDESQLIKA